MRELRNCRHLFCRIAEGRNFLITLVVATGVAAIFLLPDYFFPQDDCTEQLYPFLLETKRMLSSGAPWWTWQSFLGDNFIGSYAYYTLTRPLLLAVCLLPYKYIGAGLVASVYLNFLILGWLASCYLRIMGFDRTLRLIGSLLTALSTYMICQTCYCMFFEPVEAFVILLICIERFLRSEQLSTATLALASFAVAFVNYYFIPATMIAATMYFLCRVFCCHRERWIPLTLKAAGCVILGIAMASVVLVPLALYISAATRLTAEPDFYYGNNWALRLLSLVAPTPYEGRLRLYDIDSAYFMNMANVSVFGLLPFILYAIRHRRSWLTILCVIFIICLVTPLNVIFSPFSHPYYSRWTYALMLMVTVASLCYLRGQRGQLIPRRPVLIYCAVTWGMMITVYSYAFFVKIYKGETTLDKAWMTYIAAFILFALNTGALLLLTRWPVLSRKWNLTCVSSILIIAVAQLLNVTYQYSPSMVKGSVMYDMKLRLMASRSDCDTFASRSYFEPLPDTPVWDRNNHLFANRPSITTYISTINPITAGLGPLINNSFSWNIELNRNHESAAALLSVKDFFTFFDYPFAEMPQAALRGDRYIPMGMAYDRYSLTDDSISDAGYAERHDIMRGMLASLVIDKADEVELGRYMSPVEFCDTLPFDSLVASRRAYTCDTFAGDSHGFTATVSLTDTMVVMFSVAADPGFTATIDGRPTKIYNVNMGMSASIVPAGRHSIRYEYFPPGLRAGAIMSLAALVIFLALLLYEYRRTRRSD